jgi:O-antigen ligase
VADVTRAGGAALVCALAAGAVALGVATAVSPLLGLGAVVACALVALVLRDLALGVAVLLVCDLLAGVPGFEAHQPTAVKATGSVLLLGWVLSWFRRPRPAAGARPARPREQRLVVAVLVAFLAWAGASALWAVDAGTAAADWQRYALNAVLLLVVPAAVRSRRDLVVIAGTLAVAAAAAAASGLVIVSEEFPGRLTGTVSDANHLAAVLVPGIVMAVALAGVLRPAGARWAFACVALGCCAGLLATQSRGGLIAAGTALLTWVVVGARWRRGSAALLAVLVVLGAAYPALAPAADDRRWADVGDGSGRTDLWEVGLRIFADNPLLGVGTGNYLLAGPRYLVRPGHLPRADIILATPRVAHNTYLHVLAELGVIGLTLFVLLVALCLMTLLRAVRLFAELGDRGSQVLGAACAASLCGTLTAYFFLSAQYEKQLWLLLGTGPALLLLALRARRAGADRARRAAHDRARGAADDGARRAGHDRARPAVPGPAGRAVPAPPHRAVPAPPHRAVPGRAHRAVPDEALRGVPDEAPRAVPDRAGQAPGAVPERARPAGPLPAPGAPVASSSR